MKLKMVGLVASIPLVTSIAFAFSRDLTGLWTMPQGWTVAIAHDVYARRARLTVIMDTDETGLQSMVFNGPVIDSVRGKKDFFNYSGRANPITIIYGGDACSAVPSISMFATVVGEFGGRRIVMGDIGCAFWLELECPGRSDRQIRYDCGPVWK